MKWIFQTTGIIDHYQEKIHPGTQPIRVLHQMNLLMFQNTHPSFTEELTIAFDKYGFSKTVNIVHGETPIYKLPFISVKDKAIYLDETFLSYLWCISHAVYTLYIQEIDYPRTNSYVGYTKYKIDKSIIEQAQEIFAYAKALIKVFDKWDIDKLPNPERYHAEIRDFIEQPTIFYTEAIKFILCHEYVHAIKHLDKINNGTYENSHFIEFEKEADYEAIDLMKKGIFPSGINELAVHIGITIGILSMFYFRAETTAKKHPNTEDRLVSALEQLKLNENSPCWGIALVGLRLWSDQFKLNLQWDNTVSDRDAFYKIIQEIKEKD